MVKINREFFSSYRYASVPILAINIRIGALLKGLSEILDYTKVVFKDSQSKRLKL